MLEDSFDIISPELEKEFSALPEEEQEKVINLTHTRLETLISSEYNSIEEFTARAKKIIRDVLDEVNHKRRGLWLL